MRARYTFVCFAMPTFYAALNRCHISVMSALGHKQTVAVQKGMSALPPKADMCSAVVHVRFGPIADIIVWDFWSCL